MRSHTEVRLEITLLVKLKMELENYKKVISELRVYCKYESKSKTTY